MELVNGIEPWRCHGNSDCVPLRGALMFRLSAYEKKKDCILRYNLSYMELVNGIEPWRCHGNSDCVPLRGALMFRLSAYKKRKTVYYDTIFLKWSW